MKIKNKLLKIEVYLYIYGYVTLIRITNKINDIETNFIDLYYLKKSNKDNYIQNIYIEIV